MQLLDSGPLLLSGPAPGGILAAVSIIADKGRQAVQLLEELDIDLWVVFVRETPVMADPILELVVGRPATWHSFFMFGRNDDRIALIGNLDQANYVRHEGFTEVLSYTEGVREDFLALVERLNPRSIAVNYSVDNPSADGLTHGMYLTLLEYLDGTPYHDRLVSADDLCGRLRSRKLPSEIELLGKAARSATNVWEQSVRDIRSGMSEREIAALIDANIRSIGGEPSFQTIVNAGDKTAPGHGLPSEAILGRGDLLHVDFGVRVDCYCSDIQRLLYFPARGTAHVPAELTEAFAQVRDIISLCADKCRPGVVGYEIDALARQTLEDNGYDVYQHALGHQLGRAVHDGGAVIGPQWKRYGRTTEMPLEEGNVFTLELEIILPGIGCVGLEEDICISKEETKFLCRRQMELTVK